VNKLATRLQEIKERGGLRREATFGAVDIEARTVELSFSSEIEYPRWFGIEVLSHDAAAVNLARLNDSAALLWNHDWDDMRGVVEPGTARIDSDRKGRALVRFSKSADGEKLMHDVDDGIVTKVSVGYEVNGMKWVEERADTDVYLVTDWAPYELSFVSVPADHTVGVGRAAEIPIEGAAKPSDQTLPVVAEPTTIEATRSMTEEERKAQEEARRQADAAARTAGSEGERNRVRSIGEMGKQYGHTDLALQFISEGKSADEFQRALLTAMNQHVNKPLDEQVRAAEIGLTEKEAGNFSFLRAIRAQLPNATKADREAARFEMECSRAAEQTYGKTAKGILVPADVLNQRTFSTTTPAGGSGANLVASQLLAGSFIEMLRARTWLMQRATVIGGLVGNIDIPRQKAGNTAYWVGEGNGPAKGEPAMDQVQFSPKELAALTEITRKLMKQATPDAENIVRNDLIRAMALGIDRAGIYGSGTAFQPLGVANMTGVNAVALATAGQPSFDELVDMETAIALDNADVGAMSYAFNAAVRGSLKKTKRFPDSASDATIWEQGNTVNGYATDVSNQIDSGDVLFGNWADLIIAMWGGLDITVDPFTLADTGGTRIITFQDIDCNVRHQESFCLGRKAA
jgi:HK97 family phage major capsid protein/HK97 family phage prohead protease